MNPELFLRVGIKPPKGVLLYGPPGTGKTLLARAVASTLETSFLKVVSSAIVDKYIGESARLIREMFGNFLLSYLDFILHQAMPENTNPVLFSWTKLTLLVVAAFLREHLPIEKFSVP